MKKTALLLIMCALVCSCSNAGTSNTTAADKTVSESVISGSAPAVSGDAGTEWSDKTFSTESYTEETDGSLSMPAYDDTEAQEDDLPAESEGGSDHIVSVSEAKFGDIIVFGEFEQDDDLSNGAEPIEWVVLSEDDTSCTVISRYCLCAMQFYSNRSLVNWSGSLVREWLNGDFYSAAFNDSEKEKIVEVTNSSDAIDRRTRDVKEETVDKVYCLSLYELNDVWERLMAPKDVETVDDVIFYNEMTEKLHAGLTEYGKNECERQGHSADYLWWLRDIKNMTSAKVSGGDAAFIAGNVSYTYFDIYEGVRPVITISR